MIRRSLAFLLFLIIAIFPLSPAHALMLIPSGGWLINDGLRIRTYTNGVIYRMAAEKIIEHDFEGAPIIETITFVDSPFKQDYVGLGFRHCKSTTPSDGLVAIYSVDDDSVKKSWVFSDRKSKDEPARFEEIPTSSVTCDRSLLMD